jgi:hypothetical protein
MYNQSVLVQTRLRGAGMHRHFRSHSDAKAKSFRALLGLRLVLSQLLTSYTGASHTTSHQKLGHALSNLPCSYTSASPTTLHWTRGHAPSNLRPPTQVPHRQHLTGHADMREANLLPATQMPHPTTPHGRHAPSKLLGSYTGTSPTTSHWTREHAPALAPESQQNG